jgi:hypothetical protein
MPHQCLLRMTPGARQKCRALRLCWKQQAAFKVPYMALTTTSVAAAAAVPKPVKTSPWEICIKETKDTTPFANTTGTLLSKAFKDILGLGVGSLPLESRFCLDRSTKTSAGLVVGSTCTFKNGDDEEESSPVGLGFAAFGVSGGDAADAAAPVVPTSGSPR